MTSARIPPGPKPRLSRDEILDVALQILEAEGPDRLSLRRLGSELGVTARALYSYFDSKDDLETALVTRVMPAPPAEINPTVPWHEQLREFVLDIHDAIARHPGVAQLFITRAADNSATNRIREHLLRLLLAGGFVADEAVAVLGALSRYIVGSVVIADRQQRNTINGEQDTSRIEPGADFPVLSGVAERYSSRNSLEATRYGLDVLLLGLLEVAGGTDRLRLTPLGQR